MITAGFGFRGTATADSLHDAYLRAVAGAGGQDVTHLAAPTDKAQAAAFTTFARALSLPVVAIAPAALTGASTITRSQRVRAARGTGSVAEAAALAATGGHLLAPRVLSGDRMAACAIAIATETPT